MESLDQSWRLEVREKSRNFFCDESTSVWPQGVTQHRIFIKVFFDFARIFSLFSLVFRTSNFWRIRNLIKQLFHSRLLDMRQVIANSALRASLAIYHLISNARSWNNWNIASSSSFFDFARIFCLPGSYPRTKNGIIVEYYWVAMRQSSRKMNSIFLFFFSFLCQKSEMNIWNLKSDQSFFVGYQSELYFWYFTTGDAMYNFETKWKIL